MALGGLLPCSWKVFFVFFFFFFFSFWFCFMVFTYMHLKKIRGKVENCLMLEKIAELAKHVESL
jgi:hypothetical protein